MTVTSRAAAISALVIAAGVHMAGVSQFSFSESAKMEGGQAGATEVSLGDAFEDLAQGSLTGVEATDLTPAPAVQEVTTASELTETPTPEAPRDMVSAVVQPPVPQTSAIRQLTPAIAPSPDGVLPYVAPTVTTSPPAPEIIQGETPEAIQDRQVASLRPQVRPREIVRPALQRQSASTPRRAAPKPAATQPRGNEAPSNAHAGRTDGTSATPSQQRRASGNEQSRQAGNAAASNYPGRVMRKIQRVRRPRANSQSSARVAFRVAENGGLASLSIAKSSGSTSFDQAALQVIRRAAPFPKPPQGAQRSFSIQIKSR